MCVNPDTSLLLERQTNEFGSSIWVWLISIYSSHWAVVNVFLLIILSECKLCIQNRVLTLWNPHRNEYLKMQTHTLNLNHIVLTIFKYCVKLMSVINIY